MDAPTAAGEAGDSGAAGTVSFELRRSPWAWPFVALFAPGRHYATVGGGVLEVKVGLLGRATVPVRLVSRISSMHWPWWGGVGVRIGKRLVAFVPASGDALVVDLAEEVKVKAPFGWGTQRLVIGVEEIEGLAHALDRERRRSETGADPEHGTPRPDEQG
jgi:hypothetical protein